MKKKIYRECVGGGEKRQKYFSYKKMLHPQKKYIYLKIKKALKNFARLP